MSQSRHVPAAAPALEEAGIEELQALLDDLPPPLQPLDVCALDGFLCGALLQPNKIDDDAVLRWVCDVEGRAPPAGHDLARLRALVLHRKAQLAGALRSRQWFDPWVFELDEATSPSEALLPWIAGFAAAMDRFPEMLRIDDAALLEPLALLYQHFDPDDLEDAEALRQLIDTLEPPPDLSEAVQDLVRSLMLIADVVHPRVTSAKSARTRSAARRAPRARMR